MESDISDLGVEIDISCDQALAKASDRGIWDLGAAGIDLLPPGSDHPASEGLGKYDVRRCA